MSNDIIKKAKLEAEIAITQQKLASIKISHLLHLILSIITVGLWAFVWIFIGLSKALERHSYERKITKLTVKLAELDHDH